MVEGGVCDLKDLKTISELPPREIQLSILAGAMQAPLSKLAGLLNATLAQFIYAFEALKNRKEQA
jgi:large subunit ribosomal protein L10